MDINKTENLNEMFRKTCTKTSERKMMEDAPEIMELKRLRNEHYEKAKEYQNQIDEAVKATHNVPNLDGKYIHYLRSGSNYEHFGKVKSVDRTYNGVKITFSSELYILTNDFGSGIHFSDAEATMDVLWENVNDIEITTKEEMLKVLDSRVSDFKEKCI